MDWLMLLGPVNTVDGFTSDMGGAVPTSHTNGEKQSHALTAKPTNKHISNHWCGMRHETLEGRRHCFIQEQQGKTYLFPRGRVI